MKKTIFFLLFLILLLDRYSILAGTIGTLTGVVVEKGTRRPLAGANIIIEATQLGAAADLEGKFVIYNVPAGLYTAKVTMIGYQTQIIKAVRIISDHKTRLEIELQQQAIVGEEVIITASRPLIQPDLTSSIHIISKKEIDHLPITSFEEIMELQPGVVQGGHIRGGRATEVLYLIDGIPIRQSIEGGLGADLPRGALEEITLQTGGFNAEYGNAMSGVLNITTPAGSEQHRVWARAVDDRLGWKESNKFRQYELFGAGSIYGKAVAYFLSSDLTRSDTRWWQDMQQVFDFPIEQNFNLISKINITVTPNLKLVFQGLYSWWQQRQYEYRWRFNLPGLPPITKNSYRLSTILTHILSPRTFYTVSLSRFQVKNFMGQGDRNEVNPDQIFQYDLPWYYFITKGDRLWWQDSREITYYGKLDFISQLSDIWQIKFGAEGQYFDLHNEIVKYEPQKTFWGRPILEATPFNFNTKYEYKPWLGAAYFQTKIDNKIFAANVGIRWDVFDPRARRPIIEWIPVTGKDFRSEIKGFAKASHKSQLSPRVGFSFPILDKNFFFFSFGYFFQVPLFDYLYTGLDPEFLKKGVKLLYGDPDLKPEQTRAYEFSYKHILSDNLAATVTYFEKSISNLVDTRTFLASDSKSEDDGFSQFVNLSTAHSHGFELMLEKRHSHFFSGKLSYTNMIARGYSGNAEQGMNYFMWGFEVPNKEYYLSWDQRHTIATDFFVGDPERYGVNFVWRWHSPRPYTYYPSRDGVVPDRKVKIEPNNSRMFNVAYLDIKMSYSFWLKQNVEATLYFDYRNILDRFNVLWVASDGKIGGELGDPTAYDLGRRFYLGLKFEFNPEGR